MAPFLTRPLCGLRASLLVALHSVCFRPGTEGRSDEARPSAAAPRNLASPTPDLLSAAAGLAAVAPRAPFCPGCG